MSNKTDFQSIDKTKFFAYYLKRTYVYFGRARKMEQDLKKMMETLSDEEIKLFLDFLKKLKSQPPASFDRRKANHKDQ